MPQVAQGAQAYALMPPADPNMPRSSYRILPNDVLDLQVFEEPDLSNNALEVDTNGNLQMPLIGEISAAGRTPAEIAREIEKRLSERYVVNPQVALSIKKAAPRKVSVEGQVTKPGVYDLDSTTTLLSAIARAESPTRTARLDDIVIFRSVEGKRQAARFNLVEVRDGRAPDPQILNGDVIVVGFSHGKGAWRDFMQAAPLFNMFYLF
jgi:polysaccharide export outer membrane protein